MQVVYPIGQNSKLKRGSVLLEPDCKADHKLTDYLLDFVLNGGKITIELDSGDKYCCENKTPALPSPRDLTSEDDLL
jgi:hypothetical protein